MTTEDQMKVATVLRKQLSKTGFARCPYSEIVFRSQQSLVDRDVRSTAAYNIDRSNNQPIGIEQHTRE